ncbi:MAG: PQQ-binding-like beta-propeller repeat protein [Planctomycetaceae bacterium]
MNSSPVCYVVLRFVRGWCCFCAITALLAEPDPAALLANDWTKFQCGVENSVEQTAVPLRWSPGENIAWEAKIAGYGQSSPVTWESRVYVTSISGPKKEQCHVTAFDLTTGQRLWQHDLVTATQAENSNYVSKAAPTPVVDASGVYCFFEGGNLVALTHEGQVRWNRNLVEEFGAIESRHGLSASLEQIDDRLFVWVERQTDPYVLAVEKASGKNLWKVPGIGATSWASPRLIPVAGGQHLVLSGVGSVRGLDPQTGQELWKLAGIVGNSTPTPVPAGEGRFLIGATQGRGEGGGGNSAESNGLIRVQKQEDGTYQAEFAWRSKRTTSSFGSPLLHDGLAYYVNSSGVLFCHDLETGEERFSHRLADSIWATPFSLGNRLYFFGKGGTVSVIAEGPTFELLAENKTWNAPEAEGEAKPKANSFGGGATLYAGIYARDRLLLRRGDALYCVVAPKP